MTPFLMCTSWFNDIMGLLSASHALCIIIIIMAAKHKLTSIITNHCILMYNYREKLPLQDSFSLLELSCIHKTSEYINVSKLLILSLSFNHPCLFPTSNMQLTHHKENDYTRCIGSVL